jgi:lysophospholipase L1-like esterase
VATSKQARRRPLPDKPDSATPQFISTLFTTASFTMFARRKFMQASLTAAAGMALTQTAAAGESSTTGSLIHPGDTVLFQGDSITDAGRKRDAAADAPLQASFGDGYAWLAAASLLVDRPADKLTVLNRGISGNRVPDLDARWQAECIDLKPNVLSILIGVNDQWRKMEGQMVTTVAEYETQYRALLTRTREALPETRLVICEPFVLRCGAISDKWFPEFDERRAVAKKIAAEFSAAFVPFQTMFDAAVAYAPPEHWAADGVHPSPHGAALMAHTWRKIVG